MIVISSFYPKYLMQKVCNQYSFSVINIITFRYKKYYLLIISSLAHFRHNTATNKPYLINTKHKNSEFTYNFSNKKAPDNSGALK